MHSSCSNKVFKMIMVCCPHGRKVQMQIAANGKEFNATIKQVMFKVLIYMVQKHDI
ncbi:hypothetical protein A2U01_0048849 [Trifolium medium]|uniref:Uncharacterized protein n=1 Tax=Trifolium medium TaxID=97028 RepID=A0A392QUF1_9FABA|nr:hypothetical protein [Trifolium medium]